jgi:serine/threonine-protein kinase
VTATRPPDASYEAPAAPGQLRSSGAAPAPRAGAGWPGLGLTWRVFLAAAGVMVVVLATTLILLSIATGRSADAAAARTLEQATRLVGATLDGRERELSAAMQVLAQDPAFRPLIISRTPSDFLNLATEAVLRTGATWVQVTDSQGVRRAKSDEPAAPPVELAGSSLIAGALEGDVTVGAGVAGDTALLQAVAVPLRLRDTAISPVIGVMMAAKTVDAALADSIRQATGSEVVFYVLDTLGAPRLAVSTLPRSAALESFLARHARAAAASGGEDERAAPVAEQLGVAEGHFLARGRVLRSAGEEPLGGFVALRSRDEEMRPFAALRRQIFLAGAFGLALAFALSWLMARGIARPVLALVQATRRVAEGDYAARVDVRAPDEIGVLADAVRTMLLDLREKQALVDLLRPTPAGGRALARATVEGAGAAAAATDTGTIVPGQLLAGRYEIGQVLGVGGSGVVYRALDRALGETVAVKTLRAEALAEDPAALERLRSEIRLARRISHRNVVRTHDIGEAEGMHFITMEYVSGTSLTDLLGREGRLPVAATLGIGKQLCRALEVAHEQGIIHRDIKPANLMVQPDGVLKVMDFGVARLAQRTAGLTRVGMVVGTPAYMAPEQLLDEDVDVRADLYASGVVLYECLTGRLPWDADNAVALVARMLSMPAAPPSALNPAVPAVLSDLVLRAIAAERSERPQSASELYEALVGAES